MASSSNSMQRLYTYLNDEISDPRTKSWPMVGSPVPIILIIIGYLWFVQQIGPKFMRNKQPFNMEKLMMLYNVIQICASSFIVIEIIRTYFFRKRPNFLCDAVSSSDSPNDLYNAFIVAVYFILKLLELMDTVFFVLRKKWKHISPLHLYHHAGMVFVGWVTVKYVPGGHTMFTILLNSLVHVIMYLYYLLMLLNPELRNSTWWKKYITQMQLIQFLIILVHHLFAFILDCGYPRVVSAWVLPHICFISLLFLDFYTKAYKKREQRQQSILEQLSKSESNENRTKHK